LDAPDLAYRKQIVFLSLFLQEQLTFKPLGVALREFRGHNTIFCQKSIFKNVGGKFTGTSIHPQKTKNAANSGIILHFRRWFVIAAPTNMHSAESNVENPICQTGYAIEVVNSSRQTINLHKKLILLN
jgi:hypothetical protein